MNARRHNPESFTGATGVGGRESCAAVWRTLAVLLRDGAPHLLAAIADLADVDVAPRAHDPATLRAEAVEALASVREQLEAIAADLHDADDVELRVHRRGPHRARPAKRKESA